MNALFLAYKPAFISSNAFLHRIKKRHNIAKAGFSGTLDPFAQGSLLIAAGAYTKLLPFIPTEPKVYEATLWLGAESASLDTENIIHIDSALPFAKTLESAHAQEMAQEAVQNLRGEIAYTPPAFSAKRIDGKRAYTLARAGEKVTLEQAYMQVYDIKLLCYNPPFITFRAHVSKGSYIRSLGQIIAQNLSKALGLEVSATLSTLKRISEGGLQAKSGALIALNPLEILPFPHLVLDECIRDYFKDRFYHGKPSTLKSAQGNFKILPNTHNKKIHLSKNSLHIVQFEDFFSIIGLQPNGTISYLLNRIPYAHTL